MRGTEFPGRTYVPFSPRRRSGLISRAILQTIPIRIIRRAQPVPVSVSGIHFPPLVDTHHFGFFLHPLTAAHRAHFIKSTFSPCSRKESLSRSGGSEASSPSADGLERPPLILVRSFPRLPITLAFSFSLSHPCSGPCCQIKFS